MEEDTRVDNVIISKEDVNYFFENNLIISKKEYLKYLNYKKVEQEKVV